MLSNYCGILVVLSLHVRCFDFISVRYMLSPVRLSSVTFVHLTQPVEILGNVSTPFGTLAIH